MAVSVSVKLAISLLRGTRLVFLKCLSVFNHIGVRRCGRVYAKNTFSVMGIGSIGNTWDFNILHVKMLGNSNAIFLIAPGVDATNVYSTPGKIVNKHFS